MDLSDPMAAVVPSLDGHVLAVLAGVEESMSAREVQRRVRRGSKSGVQNVLDRLTEHGLVNVLDAPPARLYSLNRDHVAAGAATALLGLRDELFERIRRHVEHWETAPVSAAVFGSAARGDGGLESDIDLLLVRPEGVTDDDPRWSAQVDELAQQIRRWSGNPATILQMSLEDTVAMVEREAPIAASLRSDAIDLAGRPVRDLLRPSRSA